MSLFHPRLDQWGHHFRAVGLGIEAQRPRGGATVQVLATNGARRLDLRWELLVRGDFP